MGARGSANREKVPRHPRSTSGQNDSGLNDIANVKRNERHLDFCFEAGWKNNIESSVAIEGNNPTRKAGPSFLIICVPSFPISCILEICVAPPALLLPQIPLSSVWDWSQIPSNLSFLIFLREFFSYCKISCYLLQRYYTPAWAILISSLEAGRVNSILNCCCKPLIS